MLHGMCLALPFRVDVSANIHARIDLAPEDPALWYKHLKPAGRAVGLRGIGPMRGRHGEGGRYETTDW